MELPAASSQRELSRPTPCQRSMGRRRIQSVAEVLALIRDHRIVAQDAVIARVGPYHLPHVLGSPAPTVSAAARFAPGPRKNRPLQVPHSHEPRQLVPMDHPRTDIGTSLSSTADHEPGVARSAIAIQDQGRPCRSGSKLQGGEGPGATGAWTRKDSRTTPSTLAGRTPAGTCAPRAVRDLRTLSGAKVDTRQPLLNRGFFGLIGCSRKGYLWIAFVVSSMSAAASWLSPATQREGPG